MRNASSWPYIVRKHRSCAPFSDGGYGSRTIGTTWCRRPSPGWQHHDRPRSEEHTSELQSLMRISYAVFCLKKKKKQRGKMYNRQAKHQHMIKILNDQSQQLYSEQNRMNYTRKQHTNINI